MNTTHPSIRRYAALCAAGLFAIGLTACSDDGDDTAAEDTTTTVVEDETTTTEAPAEEEEPAEGDVVEVTAVEYGFEGLPEEVPTGTKLSLVNDGQEPHELVAMRIPDSETRPVSELVTLPEDQLMAVFGGQPEPATVILSAHGQTDTPGAVVGDGTLTEPGRYAIVCFLPVGSDDSILESEGPPEGDAPPHVSQGMFAELIVT